MAVITKNGLWIKDKINQTSYIINSSKIEKEFLIDSFITEFDETITSQNIRSKKIDIKSTEWLIYDAKIYENNTSILKKTLKLKTNFDYNKIQTLYSSLSSFSLFQLFELRENYKKLNYSLIEVNLSF